MHRSWLTVDGFAPEARALRAHFDDRFADERSTRGDRFVWDFWNVPGQYTHLRTPAWMYFPKKVYEAWHQRLVWWGRRTLGCHDVSPPWLSCYVSGCGQELHADEPHGPWAFVYSLTNWRGRAFRGGETILLRDEMLDYWSAGAARGLEAGGVLREIPPLFGRLSVFDPRIPHGVRRVEGTMDPREGRLVIHGWFVQPRPFVEGPLPVEELASKFGALSSVMADAPATSGMASFDVRVSAAGSVGSVKLLADTTRTPAADEKARRALITNVARVLEAMRFKKRRAASRITLPIVFE